jgi:hypothetical protein
LEVSTSGGASAGASCAEPRPPDEAALRGALKRTVANFLDSARATYGSVYADLEYSYDITATRVSGDNGSVTIHYSGSVRNIASGQREHASGTASASFRWYGCGWSRTGIDY